MDLPVRLPLGWRPLIDIAGAGALFDELYGSGAEATEHHVCRFLATDTRNPSSIINSIANVRNNARSVRETMPRVTFEYFNDLYLFARSALVAGQSRSRRSEALEGISQRTRQLEGFLSQNMLHDAHWDLLRLGNYIERADMTTRIIDVRTEDLFADDHELEPFQHIQWFAVLRSFYAMQSLPRFGSARRCKRRWCSSFYSRTSDCRGHTCAAWWACSGACANCRAARRLRRPVIARSTRWRRRTSSASVGRTTAPRCTPSSTNASVPWRPFTMSLPRSISATGRNARNRRESQSATECTTPARRATRIPTRTGWSGGLTLPPGSR